LFFNTALITFFVEILTFKNYYQAGGMIFTESIVFIMNAFIPPLVWIFDPWGFFKNIIRNHEVSKGEKSVLT
jgi:hypothetical protein